MRYQILQTDFDHRYHFRVDTHAAGEFNAFTIELPPYTCEPGLVVRQREGVSMEDLWREAFATLDFLRGQPFPLIYPRDVFMPMGVITAVNFEDIERDLSIKVNMLVGGCFDTDDDRARREQDSILSAGAHEQRVLALCRALDFVNGAPLPSSRAVAWGRG